MPEIVETEPNSQWSYNGNYAADLAAAQAAAAAREAENQRRIDAAIAAGEPTYTPVVYNPNSSNPIESAGTPYVSPTPETPAAISVPIDRGLVIAQTEMRDSSLQKINDVVGINSDDYIGGMATRKDTPRSYDVVGLMESGKVSDSEIAAVFGGEAVSGARKTVDAMDAVDAYKTPDGGYSLVAAKYDGVSNETLIAAGFSKSEVEEAAKFAGKTPSWGDWLTYYKPFHEGKNDAYNEYVKRFGFANWAKSAYQSASESMFPPARALRSDVTVGDITATEWGAGVTQVALFALPAFGLPAKIASGLGASKQVVAGIATAGRVASRTTQLGIGGVMTYDTVRNWDNLSEVEKVVSVAFDTLIIGTAFSGVKSPIRKGSNYKVNTAAKNTIKTFTSPETTQAISNVEMAMQRGNVKALKAAARNLELMAGKAQGQLGAATITKKAQLIQANPKDYIKVAKEKPNNPKINEGLEANRQFVKNAEDALKRVKDPTRRAAVEEALKQARKQVQVAEKVRLEPAWEIDWLNAKPKSAPIEKSTKEIVVREEKGTSPAKRKVTETRIAVREFASRPLSEVARKYKVTEDSIRWAVQTSSKPIQREMVYAIAKYMVDVQTSPKVKPVTETKIKEDTETEAVVEAAAQTEPATETQPETDTKTDLKTETEVETETKTPTPKPVVTTTKTDKKRGRIPLPEVGVASSMIDTRGTVAWRQGEINGKAIWYVVNYPYASNKDVFRYIGELPEGVKNVKDGKGSALKSIQLITGRAPEQLTIDLGIQDVIIVSARGKAPSISFRADPEQKTKNKLSIKRGAVKTNYAPGMMTVRRK